MPQPAAEHVCGGEVRAKARTVGVRTSDQGGSGALSIPRSRALPSRNQYCSPRGDFCLGVSDLGGRIKFSFWTRRFRGGYKLCVNGPGKEACKGFGFGKTAWRGFRRSRRLGSPIPRSGAGALQARAGTNSAAVRSEKPCGSLAPEPLLSDRFGADLTASKCCRYVLARDPDHAGGRGGADRGPARRLGLQVALQRRQGRSRKPHCQAV